MSERYAIVLAKRISCGGYLRGFSSIRIAKPNLDSPVLPLAATSEAVPEVATAEATAAWAVVPVAAVVVSSMFPMFVPPTDLTCFDEGNVDTHLTAPV